MARQLTRSADRERRTPTFRSVLRGVRYGRNFRSPATSCARPPALPKASRTRPSLHQRHDVSTPPRTTALSGLKTRGISVQEIKIKNHSGASDRKLLAKITKQSAARKRKAGHNAGQNVHKNKPCARRSLWWQETHNSKHARQTGFESLLPWQGPSKGTIGISSCISHRARSNESTSVCKFFEDAAVCARSGKRHHRAPGKASPCWAGVWRRPSPCE